MELALEGERLCKAFDLKNGIKFFEEAIKVGTNDDRTLSAIYSQLGNAYFSLGDYQRALEYHKQDVELVQRIGDEAAEAKACGNLGNTYKMLGKFDEAAVYCRRYLSICQKLNDKVGEGRALYNLGNVYHTQGKRLIGTCEHELSELSPDIRSSLLRAVEYYEKNLEIVTALNDNISMGRAYGNLGNTHYLLGNFSLAVENHKKRLELAKKTNDKQAERRAYLNLGNANVFIGNFNEAIENYSATLKSARELQDKYTEAHSCYSLANTYTFLRDYKSAITYHLKYLDMIKEFDDKDKLGEGRAYWSLVNLYQMLHDPVKALEYAKKHHEIAEMLGDKTGLASAKLNIQELETILAERQAAQSATANSSSSHHRKSSHEASNNDSCSNSPTRRPHVDSINGFRLTLDKRQEQEQRRFKKQLNSNLTADIDGLNARRRTRPVDRGGPVKSTSSERLFDMIAHFQSGRIDDQRCEILKKQPNNATKTTSSISGLDKVVDNKENFVAPGQNYRHANDSNRASQPSIMTANPIFAAASAIKATYRKASLAAYPASLLPSTNNSASTSASYVPQRRPTVSVDHQEKLFDLIAGAQKQRMDEQRASLPVLTLPNGVPPKIGLKHPTGICNKPDTVGLPYANQSSSVQASNAQTSVLGQSQQRPASGSIQESPCMSRRGKSNSITPPAAFSDNSSGNTGTSSLAKIGAKASKLTKRFQTFDNDVQVHDDARFLDNLMKYQSTRFNDQRSEIPTSMASQSSQCRDNDDSGQADNFFNLIARFQSGRIEDQRSMPPVKKNI